VGIRCETVRGHSHATPDSWQHRFPRCSTTFAEPHKRSHLICSDIPEMITKSAVHLNLSYRLLPNWNESDDCRQMTEAGWSIHAPCLIRPWGPALQRSLMWRLTQSSRLARRPTCCIGAFGLGSHTRIFKGARNNGAEQHGSPSWTRRFQSRQQMCGKRIEWRDHCTGSWDTARR
jgi:hypothetical protein